MKDTFFSIPRFVCLCRKDMVENWRAHVLRIVLMYGIMAVALLWYGYLDYRYKSTLVLDDDIWKFGLILFMICLLGFGCLSASFTLEKMKTKTSRLAMLMTPATSFEKYFSRWLVSTFLFLVVFLITFRLADYTRVLVYSLSYPELEGITSISLSNFVGDQKEYSTIFRTMREFSVALLFYFFLQSCFVLGSSIWAKNAFLKTFAAGAVVTVIYLLVAVGLTHVFSNGYGVSSTLSIDTVYTLFAIFTSFFTLLNWTLGYFRFKESEIITRM